MAKSGRTKAEKRKLLFGQQRGVCYYCGIHMALTQGKPNSATFEHCVPKSAYGPTTYANLVLACKKCNEARGSGVAPRKAPFDHKTGIWQPEFRPSDITKPVRRASHPSPPTPPTQIDEDRK